MLERRTLATAVLGLGAALLTSCATSRSEILPSNPLATLPSTQPTKPRKVFLRSVTDERVFAEESKDPTVPTLGSGGAFQASTEVKARAIARKRNTYGTALGDVLLEKSATVADVVEENVTAALREAGYGVTMKADEAGERALVLDVHIKQFWEWFEPGFWAVKLHTEIATNLEGPDLPEPVVVSVSVQHSYQAASEDSYLEVLEEGLKAYRARLRDLSASLPP